MKLAIKQFERLFQENRLVLSVVGMSHVGKTYWAEKLREVGFLHMNCDDFIEAKLASVLNGPDCAGIKGVARWMGYPSDERYAAHQEIYVSLEREVMEDVFLQIKNGRTQNTVIDTTGSIVHTGRNVCDALNRRSMVIYIEASESMRKEMFRRYLKEPKPVVFGSMYRSQGEESIAQTLNRCYRKLLNVRSVLYAECADVVIPCAALEHHADAHQFMSLIRRAL